MADADLSISFNNTLSKTSFVGRYDFWMAPIAGAAQYPAATMQADDTQIIAVNTGFFAGAGAAWFWSCWYDPVTKVRFGVRIDAGMQPFGFGNRPTWQVMFDKNDQTVDPVWTPSGNDPAQQYAWAKSIGFDITAVPESAHETLQISVMIQALL